MTRSEDKLSFIRFRLRNYAKKRTESLDISKKHLSRNRCQTTLNKIGAECGQIALKPHG